VNCLLSFLLFGIIFGQEITSSRHNDALDPLRAQMRHRSISYTGLGTFSLAPPFTNTDWLPSRPSFIGTSFTLFTRLNPTTPQRLRVDRRTSIRASHLNASLPVKILVHGFLQHRQSPFLINMTRALLDYAPMNVIVVGWSGGAGFPYNQAVANTRVVGAQVAGLLHVLAEFGVNVENVHVIGHSLGAQVAGYAGARTPGLGRITGLDPAQPSFEGFSSEVHLDKTDANFVDIIHTDAVPYDTVGGYGIIHPVGDIDFYPNGGHHQPGCHEEPSVFSFFQDVWSRGIHSAEVSLSCSHERSTKLFLASITSHDAACDFRSFPCANEREFTSGRCSQCGNRPCPLMGYHADKSFGARGSFYLNTTNAQPYCGHHFFVTFTMEPGMAEVDGVISVKLHGENGATELTEVARNSLRGGREYTGMILDGALLGQIQAVDVHFEQDSNLGSYLWGQSRLKLDKLSVTHAERPIPKYFCKRDMTIESGHHITLDNGSYMPDHC